MEITQAGITCRLDNPSVTAELKRLNSYLPLAARQARLPPVTRALHRGILQFLLDKGRAPDKSDFGDSLPATPDLNARLQALAAADLLVLDPDTRLPLGAYPLTSEVTSHYLSIGERHIYAMCALDAVSVAPMFGVEVIIESSCQQTGTPIRIRMRDDKILATDLAPDCLIGIRWQAPSAVAAYSMCMQMVFLRDPDVARAWQNNDLDGVSLLSLPLAVAVGLSFFRPLLDR